MAEVAKVKGLLDNSEKYGKDKIEILAELTRIRQICCDPSLLFPSYSGESAKREATMDLVKSALDGGHKILLFSQFTSMLALLEEDLKRERRYLTTRLQEIQGKQRDSSLWMRSTATPLPSSSFPSRPEEQASILHLPTS